MTVTPEGFRLSRLVGEYLEGTVTIEIWALEHPSVMRVDLAGESVTHQGTLDLQRCLSFPDHCF